MIDYEKTITSQFANSPTICALIENMNEYIDPRADIQAFYDFVWNVNTAESWGLDIWGKIVGVKRSLQITPFAYNFGFNTPLDSFKPFNVAPFRNSRANPLQAYSLTDTAYRKLILTKALANISSTTIPSLNQILNKLFPNRGRCYVQDLGNMAIKYVFEFKLQAYEVAIIEVSGVMPKPAGVRASTQYYV